MVQDRGRGYRRRDARLIGETVARSLAMQFEKASRFGIPLKLLRASSPISTRRWRARRVSPASCCVGRTGREVRSAIGPLVGVDTVVAPVSIDGVVFGQVAVSTTPSTLSTVLSGLYWRGACWSAFAPRFRPLLRHSMPAPPSRRGDAN